MGILVATPVSFGIQSLGTGTHSVTWTAATLSTAGWAFSLIFGNNGGALSSTGLSLSVDGALGQSTTQLNRGADTRGRFFGAPLLSNATQDISASFTGGDNTGSCELIGWELSGTFNTAAMFGATPLAVTDDGDQSADIVLATANAAILCAVQGSGSVGNVTSSGLTFVDTDTGNAQRVAWSSHCADAGAAGTKTLTWTGAGDWFYAVEIQSGGPAVSSVRADYSQFPKYPIRARAQGIR